MTDPVTLSAWVLAAGIEAQLILMEADTGESVPYANRPLSEDEKRAKVRFGDIDAIITVNTADGEAMADELYEAAIEALMDELFGSGVALAEGDPDEPRPLGVASAVAALAAMLTRVPSIYRSARDKALTVARAAVRASFMGGVGTVADEAARQGVVARWAAPQPPELLTLLASDVVDHPWRRTVERLLTDLRTPARTLQGSVTAEEIRRFVEDTPRKGTVDLYRQANQAALGAGRAAMADAFAGEFIVAIASELMDSNTCGPCRAIDGTRFPSLVEAKKAYPAGYRDCLGRARCRGICVYVFDAP